MLRGLTRELTPWGGVVRPCLKEPGDELAMSVTLVREGVDGRHAWVESAFILAALTSYRRQDA